MDKGIYTALSGGLAKARELELIANNLANVSTPGFKKDGATFQEYLSEVRKPDTVEALDREIKSITLLDGRAVGDKSFVEMDAIYTNFSQGLISKTNRPLDVALEGKGFFEVSSPFGTRFTRQGNFNISKEGFLVTANGYKVLQKGVGPEEARAIRFGNGRVDMTEEGDIFQNGQRIATLSVVEFKESQWLEKVGNSYFRNMHKDNIVNPLTQTLGTKVHQGSIEGSNVNPIKEMTRLIEASRAYESHLQAVKTYQEIDEKTANQIIRGSL